MVQIIDWYHVVANAIFGAENGYYFTQMIAALGVLLLVTLVGLGAGLYKLQPEKMKDEELLPPKKFGIRAFVELCWSVVSSTLESVVGAKHWQKFATILGGTFFFIIISNLSGLVPGFHPPTSQMNTTLAIAIVIFVAFIFIGLKEGGVEFIKHMAGPMLLLAPLIFIIELIGMFARPLSLSLRLFGNISGDHMVVQVFSTLLRDAPYIPVPAALLGFGTLVACMQAFIFMVLSAVYIRLSLDTAEHHH